MITGLRIIDDIIDEDTEKKIIEELDKETWSTKLSRRTQHYGYEYNYKNGNATKKAPAFPKCVLHISDFLKKYNIINAEQCIVNEYNINQGISKHIDSNDFGPVIVSLSLGDHTNFIFSKNGESITYEVPRRSLLIMTDESRYQWTHEIPKRKTYTLNGETIHKNDNYRRISMTFRTKV